MVGIIKDSSIWKTPISNLKEKEINRVDIGTVINERYSKELDSIIYSVEVYSGQRRSVVECIQMVKNGDIYNYEEIKLRYQLNRNNKNTNMSMKTRFGEMVLVTYVSGIGSFGVIIGSIKHSARKSKLISKDIAYVSEYNGIETSIDKDGAYKLKFQGTPINIKNAKDGFPLPSPKYDDSIAGSFLSFDKIGNFTLTDANKEKPQTIKIDKKNGSIHVISGDVSLTIEKNSKKISIKSEDINIDSKKKVSIKTPEYSIDSSKAIKIKGQKIAIGYGGNELLDILTNLIDEIGLLVITSPVGPCTPIQGSPTWVKILALKTKISTIKGSL